MRKFTLLLAAALGASAASGLHAQTYDPIPVTGFNHDIVAESGSDALSQTDTVLDATSHIMYAQAFAGSNGLSGGLPDNGQISNAAGTRRFQLQLYNGDNALTLMRNVSGALNLVTPASYNRLSLLAFSTEGSSTVNIRVNFTDGSSSAQQTVTLNDWFFATSNVVTTGFGRITRLSAPPYSVDGYPNDPRFYYIDISLSCPEAQKLVSSISISNATTSGFNAPFPNTVILGLAGYQTTQAVTTSSTPTGCTGATGTATANVSGNGPFTYSWSTSPVQTGATATNLPAGNYTVTVTNSLGCAYTYPVTVAGPAPVTPVATATPSIVCPGASTQLSVTTSTGSIASATWTPGNLSGATVTVAPAGTTSYTVSGSTSAGCAYTATVSVTVSSIPDPVVSGATICSGETAQLTVTNPTAGVTYNWYTVPNAGTPVGTGSTFTTPALSSNTTYYVEGSAGSCYSSRIQVLVTVRPVPATPAAPGASICSGTTATLSVTNPVAGETYSWYAAPTGGTALGTGSSFTTPVLTSNTTYYVDAFNGNCRTGTRTPVTVTVTQIPPAPSAPGATICAGNTATLTVQSPNLLYTYNWYAAATGGTALASTPAYTTPVLNSTTTYYLDASSGACTSSPRTAVLVTVNAVPATLAPMSAGICAGTTTALTLQNPVAGTTYSWFSTATGGSPFFTGTSYTPPALTANTVYYIESGANGCTGPGRATMTVTVETAPAAPVIAPATICSGSTASLSVSSPAAGATYTWYTAASGGTALATGSTFTTPALSASNTYYVAASSSLGCSDGNRTAVPVTVTTIPGAPAAAGASICPGSSTTLTVTAPQPGITYQWFDAASGGTAVQTGDAFTTPSLSGDRTWYLQASAGSCAGPRTPVTVTVYAVLATPVVSGVLNGTTATFTWAPVAGASSYEVSANNGGTWTAPSAGPSATSQVVSNIPIGQQVTLQVRALTAQACQRSGIGQATVGSPIDDVFVPNVFTPNGDGRNDQLQVYATALQSMEFRVYDQWGNEVFRATDPKAGWDGTYRGQRAPVGVYVYALKAVLPDGRVVTKKGSVNLLR